MNDNRSLLVFKELKNLGVKVSKVKRLKCAHPKQKFVSSKTPKGIFGVNLCDQEWIPVGEDYLPRFLVLVTTFLQNYICELGLFRKAGSVSRQRKLKEKLNGGSSLDREEAGPHDVAALLKQWLRELPESLLPSSLHEIFLKCLQLESVEHQTTACLLTCLLLPTDRLLTLKHLLQFLASVVACSDKNKMDLSNVSVVLAPTLFISEVNKQNTATQFVPVMQLLIENADKVGDMELLKPSPDVKSAPELQCPSEFPAVCSPKRKSVHDVLNGIKKLVGQGGLVSPSKLRMPSESPVRRHSSSKRKGDTVTPLTPAKKSKEEGYFNTTPKCKVGSNKEGKTKPNQSRHKTFDLLRRRNKKHKNPGTSTANFYEMTPLIFVTDENGTSSNLRSKGTEVSQATPLLPSLRFSFEKTINLDSKSVTSSTSDIPELNKISPKQIASKSESSAEPVTPLVEVIRLPDSVPSKNEAGITRTPSVPTRNKSSFRKQGTISRQEAFIFRRDTSVSKADHVIQLAKKNTTTNKSSRQKLHKTMPLNKSTPSTKQVRNKNLIANLKRNVTITSSLDFHPRNIEKIDFKEIDCALTFDFENLALEEVSPPPEQEEDPVFELPAIHAEFVGTPEYVKITHNQQETPDQNTKNKTLQSNKKFLPTTQPRTPVSRIPRLSSTGSISQTHSELKRNSKVRRSAGSNANFTPFKSPNGLSDLNASANPGLDASCCKTPGAFCSPGSDSIHWISASKFLSAETPKEEAVPNKRESIAMILRNKGHVKNKISIYDVQVRLSMHASRSCSTPIENNSLKIKPQSDRPKKQDLAVTKSCELNRRPRNKTPRPSPLPKFVMPDIETPPKQPLQQSANSSRSIHSIQEENDHCEVDSTSTSIKEEDVQNNLSENVHQDSKIKEDQVQIPGDLSRKLSSLCDRVHKMGLQDSTNLRYRTDSPVKENWSASPDKTRSTPVKDTFCIFQDLDKNSILSPMKENLVLSPVNVNLLSPVWKQKRQTNRKSKEKRHSSFSGATVMYRGGRKVLRSKSSPAKKIRVHKNKILKDNRRLVAAV